MLIGPTKIAKTLALPFVQYLENQKAVAAVIYANSIAMMPKPLPGATAASAAATLSAQFQRNGQMAFEILLFKRTLRTS